MERINPKEVKIFDFKAYCDLVGRVGSISKKALIEDDNDSNGIILDAREDLDFIARTMQSFFNYVNTVDIGESTIRIAKHRHEPDDFEVIRNDYIRSRAIAYNAALTNCSIINRLAKNYAIGDIFLGDITDEASVADFCLDVVADVFKNRIAAA